MNSAIKVLTVLFIFSLSITVILAEEAPKFNDSDIETLITGIKSENSGLMRSSIFIAGKYRIEGTIDALLEVLETESDPSNLVLIALAIYRIGDREAMMKVIEAANSSVNMHIKNILSAIAMNYLVEDEIQFVLR